MDAKRRGYSSFEEKESFLSNLASPSFGLRRLARRRDDEEGLGTATGWLRSPQIQRAIKSKGSNCS